MRIVGPAGNRSADAQTAVQRLDIGKLLAVFRGQTAVQLPLRDGSESHVAAGVGPLAVGLIGQVGFGAVPGSDKYVLTCF